MAISIAEALHQSLTALASFSETARLDGEVWLARVLGAERSWLLAHGEQPLSERQASDWASGLQRLAAGEPLPYLLGEWEFYGLPFQVSPAVLIPRPETELLVEEAIGWLRGRKVQAQPYAPARAADVGTGSGIIPIAIAANVADVHFHAIDLSAEALAVAHSNVARHGLSQRIRLQRGDLLAALHTPLDLITANLPYIPSPRVPTLAVAAWEPQIALDGGADGLVLIRTLLQQAQQCLQPGGLLLEEIDPELEDASLHLARQTWPSAQVDVLPDLAGRPRLLRVALAGELA
ncbi:MAG: peptide chain release factor N(5)-glutamine methyltransferase [Anaerolineales bacterium]|nr:peptide chain release factor N(5)-glutamine methyltransferase [Anaerolineales bacterium]